MKTNRWDHRSRTSQLHFVGFSRLPRATHVPGMVSEWLIVVSRESPGNPKAVKPLAYFEDPARGRSPRRRSRGSHQYWMKLFQIPLEPAYPMAFQAVSGPPASSPKWQGFGCNKFRDVQALSTMRDTPSMVQKLLEEEREAVKSALQAVDEHMQLKKKEVEEVHRKLMKDEPMKEQFRAAFSMDMSRSSTRSSRVSSSYTPVYNPPIKIQQQKPIFLEAIYEEDNDSGALSLSSNKNEKRPERIRHSAMPTRTLTAKSRCSVKEKVTSARPRVSEVSVLPPIDMGWSNIPTDGCYTGPLNYRWQRVADNYIDSDVRVRSRRRCRSRAMETKIRLGYQEDDETEDECNGLVEMELRLPRKRQITFGPPHSTSYSRWFSHFNGLDSYN